MIYVIALADQLPVGINTASFFGFMGVTMALVLASLLL